MDRADRLIAPMLTVLGVIQIALGAWMAAAPRSFFDAVGPFGAYNDHYVRDAASFTLALGVVALLGARRPSWRPAVLAFATLQLGLHAVNHVVDIGDADPRAAGIADAVSLLAATAVYGLLLRAAVREAP